LPLSVAPHASVAIIIHRGEAPPLHVVSSTVDTLLVDQGAMIIGDVRGGRQQLQLSNGKTLAADLTALPAPLSLVRWNLHVDEKTPTGPVSHDIASASLGDWRAVAELKNAVGQALYSTDVVLPENWFGADKDQLLAVGDVAGAMRLTVNGHPVTEQTVGNDAWLVGKWLKPGTNQVAIGMDTTLLNRMVQLRESGEPRYQTGPTALASAPSGVIGPVTLRSVLRVPLESSMP
jgi:hypothetical protein